MQRNIKYNQKLFFKEIHIYEEIRITCNGVMGMAVSVRVLFFLCSPLHTRFEVRTFLWYIKLFLIDKVIMFFLALVC
jgi:hypothetical protein